ncbi:MAG: PAS domain-containing protein [Clostridiales bacterium]|nr:PAS domain-containing protein [Clostridiales bacterium]
MELLLDQMKDFRIEVTLISLILTTILWVVLFIYLLMIENKTQIFYAFMITIASAFLWSIGNTLEIYSYITNGTINISYIYLGFIGLCFVPVSIFFVGLIFSKTMIKFSWKHALLLVFPVLDCIFILTNESHGLFITHYAPNNAQMIYGKYFMVHTFVSYSYLLVGLFFLGSASVKNTGFFSKQSGLIFAGIATPLIFNVVYTLGLADMNVYLTTISFSIAVILFVLAILKFSFLNVIPIALRSVIDNISDSFLVVNNDLKVVDHNKTIIDTFGRFLKIKRNMPLHDVFSMENEIHPEFQEIIEAVARSNDTGDSLSFDKHIIFDNFDRFFQIEISPIRSKTKTSLGTIILLKDITQSVRDMETIKEKQDILMGQERLASLGQLIGGIAHNLKTPIMSISGGTEGIRDLANEYLDSIDDESVTSDDHKEIAKEILEWVDKIKPHCGYMSDIISAVKGQAVQFNTSGIVSFTVDEVIKRIGILLKHELIRYHATMRKYVEIDKMTEVSGDINSLVQVLDNLIINSIQSYEGEEGKIVFKITENDNNVIFSIADKGKGMADELKTKLFNEMVTTKGKDGTGLGLFMSYSTIKGHFEGDMWFKSQLGVGTTFYVSIPKLSSAREKVKV